MLYIIVTKYYVYYLIHYNFLRNIPSSRRRGEPKDGSALAAIFPKMEELGWRLKFAQHMFCVIVECAHIVPGIGRKFYCTTYCTVKGKQKKV